MGLSGNFKPKRRNLSRMAQTVTAHVTKIRAKFHSNSFIKYADIASREIGVNGQRPDGQTAGPTDNPKTT